MSYDISIDTRESGGACRVLIDNHPLEDWEGQHEALLNVPYMQESAFQQAFGDEKGVHLLDYMDVKESLPIIDAAINRCDNEGMKTILQHMRTLADEALKASYDQEIMWTIDWDFQAWEAAHKETDNNA